MHKKHSVNTIPELVLSAFNARLLEDGPWQVLIAGMFSIDHWGLVTTCILVLAILNLKTGEKRMKSFS